MHPTLVIVNGMPGTGKTTLSKKLASDLHLPLLGKDALKEFLFDTIGTGDLAWSQTLGTATFVMLYDFIDTMLDHKVSVLIECPFYREFAAQRIDAALKRTKGQLIEVYCSTVPAIRRQRFIERSERGERHSGHVDTAHYGNSSDAEPTQYEPLALGELIKVDTTAFGNAEYAKLRKQLEALLDKR